MYWCGTYCSTMAIDLMQSIHCLVWPLPLFQPRRLLSTGSRLDWDLLVAALPIHVSIDHPPVVRAWPTSFSADLAPSILVIDASHRTIQDSAARLPKLIINVPPFGPENTELTTTELLIQRQDCVHRRIPCQWPWHDRPISRGTRPCKWAGFATTNNDCMLHRHWMLMVDIKRSRQEDKRSQPQ